jgi:hypothetical protein
MRASRSSEEGRGSGTAAEEEERHKGLFADR